MKYLYKHHYKFCVLLRCNPSSFLHCHHYMRKTLTYHLGWLHRNFYHFRTPLFHPICIHLLHAICRIQVLYDDTKFSYNLSCDIFGLFILLIEILYRKTKYSNHLYTLRCKLIGLCPHMFSEKLFFHLCTHRILTHPYLSLPSILCHFVVHEVHLVCIHLFDATWHILRRL